MDWDTAVEEVAAKLEAATPEAVVELQHSITELPNGPKLLADARALIASRDLLETNGQKLLEEIKQIHDVTQPP